MNKHTKEKHDFFFLEIHIADHKKYIHTWLAVKSIKVSQQPHIFYIPSLPPAAASTYVP